MQTLSEFLGRQLLIGDVIRDSNICSKCFIVLINHSYPHHIEVDRREILLSQELVKHYAFGAYHECLISWVEYCELINVVLDNPDYVNSYNTTDPLSVKAIEDRNRYILGLNFFHS